MNFEIIIQPSAQIEIEYAYQWIASQSPSRAIRWYNNLIDTIYSLETFPTRCVIAPENEDFEDEIRQLLYGKKSGIYRVLFTIRENEVHILHIRHSARDYLKP